MRSRLDGRTGGPGHDRARHEDRHTLAYRQSLRSAAFTRRSGFTLIELVVVMVILVLLAATVTVVVIRRAGQARIGRAKVDITTLENALELYNQDNQGYPTSEQGLQALIEKPTSPPEAPNWNGKYVKGNNIPKDPWGNEYKYEYPGQNNQDGFDLWTLGKDNKEDGTGEDADANNWSE